MPACAAGLACGGDGNDRCDAQLQGFKRGYEQADIARMVPRLFNPVSEAAAFELDGFIWLAGGRTMGNAQVNSVQRARLQLDGTLGQFEVRTDTLTTARAGAAAVVLPDRVLLMGGENSNVMSVDSTEFAMREATGLGPWTSASSATLAAPAQNMTAVAKNAHVWVIGGRDGSTPQGVQDGTPAGTFMTTAPVNTSFTARWGHVMFQRNGRVIVAGGVTENMPTASAVSAAFSTGLSTFTSDSGFTLAAPVVLGTPLSIGSHAYVVGGTDMTPTGTDTPVSTMQVSTVDMGGNPSGFATVTAGAPATPRLGMSSVTHGLSAHVMGGMRATGGPTNEVTYAPTARTATVGDFIPAQGVPFQPSPRTGHTSAILGEYLYVLGGEDGTGPVRWQAVHLDAATGQPEMNFFDAGPTELPQGACFAVMGNALLVVGGMAGGAPRPRIQRILLAEGNGLGDFDGWQGPSTEPRMHPACIVVDDVLYVMGGADDLAGTNLLDTTEAFRMQSDGTLMPIAAPALQLSMPRFKHHALLLNDVIYVMGGIGDDGMTHAPTPSIETADLSGGTAPAVFMTSAASLQVPRARFSVAVIGEHVLVMGGEDASGNPVTSTEEAYQDAGRISGFQIKDHPALPPGGCIGACVVRLGRQFVLLGGTLDTGASGVAFARID